MSATERLYYEDSHLKEFEARVVSVAAVEGGRASVVLDRTAFYPEGGGQPSDTGLLGEARVVECVDEEGEGVRHVVEGRVPEVGAVVRGSVDWPRRLEHMQQHTGQHILSQAFVRLFGAQTRSFRMMEHTAEIDVALEEPSDERVARAVELANRIIWEDRPVLVRYATARDASALALRKDSARAGELRIIEIEDFDLSPCGGTHAKRTGEVGVIAVRAWERAKGLTRVEFVAGVRALADYTLANATARRVAALFSVGRDDAPASVERLQDENKRLARRVRELEEVASRVEAGELYAEAVPRPGDDVRVIARAFEGRDAESLKRLAHALVANPRTVALLGSHEGGEVRLVFARSPDADADMSALLREACARLGGRGGGRPDFAQGGGRADETQLRAALDRAAEKS